MSHIFLDTRRDRLALYMHGDLQFDRDDEHLYHEPLALVPTLLAGQRHPSKPLRVLILGGGDGLALREALKSPQTAQACLVERDPGVLGLGRGALAQLNANALADPRTRVCQADARDFLPQARGFDVIIYDLTYPRDLEGTALFTVERFAQARAALAPQGILAVNAVSPEKTPQAYACIGASLAEAGLSPRPYSCLIPSFAREGCGRWGFFLASRHAVRDRELLGLTLPAGAHLSRNGILESALLPAAFRSMKASANRNDELLYYIYNSAPLAWTAPFLRAGFKAVPGPGPRLTAAHGFSQWLRSNSGHRSLEQLLSCLPISQHEQTHKTLLEWSDHAETIFRELDLSVMVRTALRRAEKLPKAWVLELRRFQESLRSGIPDMRTLLEQSWRVFAVFLLVLMLANLFFPDNIYAKGFSSHHGGSDGDISMSWTSQSSSRPYRYSGRGGGRVYDSKGNAYAAQNFAFTDPARKARVISSLLALSPELQLLDSGAVAYVSAPKLKAIVEPGRLSLLGESGAAVLTLQTPAWLMDDIRQKMMSQRPLLEKAMADLRQWLDWTKLASVRSGQEDPEMRSLQAIRKAILLGESVWQPVPTIPPLPAEQAGWLEIYPGVRLEPSASQGAPQRIAFILPGGGVRLRGAAPARQLTDEDRAVFHLLYRRFSKQNDRALQGLVSEWVRLHGPALGAQMPPPPASPAPSSLQLIRR